MNNIFYIRGPRGVRLATFAYRLDPIAKTLSFAHCVRNPKDRDDKNFALIVAKKRLDMHKNAAYTVEYSGPNEHVDIVKAIYRRLLNTTGSVKGTRAVPNRVMRELKFLAMYHDKLLKPQNQ